MWKISSHISLLGACLKSGPGISVSFQAEKIVSCL